MTTQTDINWKALGLSYEPARGAYKRLGNWRRPDGTLAKKTFYFGQDPVAAFREKVRLEAAWEQKRATAKELSRQVGIKILPVWNETTLAELERTGRYISLPPTDDEGDGVVQIGRPQQRLLTMAEGQKRFFENCRTRVGLAGRRGILQNTFNNLSRFLPTVLSHLAQDTDLCRLTYADFERFVNFWTGKPIGRGGKPLADRTVHHYLQMTVQFIDWLENRPDLTFRWPKGARKMVKDSMQGLNNPAEFEYFSTADLKDMMGKATDRLRLYMMIALNSGQPNARPLAVGWASQQPRPDVGVLASFQIHVQQLAVIQPACDDGVGID